MPGSRLAFESLRSLSPTSNRPSPFGVGANAFAPLGEVILLYAHLFSLEAPMTNFEKLTTRQPRDLWPNAWFLEAADRNVGEVVGQAKGLALAGRMDLAERWSKEFLATMDYIILPRHKAHFGPYEQVESAGEDTYEVPRYKVILTRDDPNSFGYLIFSAVHPDVLRQARDRRYQRDDLTEQERESWESFSKANGLLDSYSYLPDYWRTFSPWHPHGMRTAVHYQRWMNGGIIYRGPRAGSDPAEWPERLWTTHS